MDDDFDFFLIWLLVTLGASLFVTSIVVMAVEDEGNSEIDQCVELLTSGSDISEDEALVFCYERSENGK